MLDLAFEKEERTVRVNWLRNAFGIAVLVIAMAYSALALVDPPTNASAASCCGVGLQCGPGSICCKPDPGCEFPCDPEAGKPGYCRDRCIRCS